MQKKIELFKSKLEAFSINQREFLEWLTKEIPNEIELEKLDDENLIKLNVEFEEKNSHYKFDESYADDFFALYTKLFEEDKTKIILTI
jgi:hypothetical protein